MTRHVPMTSCTAVAALFTPQPAGSYCCEPPGRTPPPPPILKTQLVGSSLMVLGELADSEQCACSEGSLHCRGRMVIISCRNKAVCMCGWLGGSV